MERKIPLNQHDLVYLIESIKNSWLVKGSLAFLSTMLVHLFGAWDITLMSLVTLMVLDLIAKMVRMSYENGGFLKAIREGRIKSRIAREKSVYKAIRYALIVASGQQIARIFDHSTLGVAITISGIPIGFAIKTFFILNICLSEVISIIETLMGVDGDDLEDLKNTMTSTKKSIIDKVIDLFLRKIDERIFSKKEDKED